MDRSSPKIAACDDHHRLAVRGAASCVPEDRDKTTMRDDDTGRILSIPAVTLIGFIASMVLMYVYYV
jgi:hypothetical protein